MALRNKTVMWIDALAESKEHWEDNLRKARLITADDLVSARRFHQPPSDIRIGYSSCACCKTAARRECNTPCPLSSKDSDDGCQCCEEWYEVSRCIYEDAYSKEDIVEAMKKMIKRLDDELSNYMDLYERGY